MPQRHFRFLVTVAQRLRQYEKVTALAHSTGLLFADYEKRLAS